MDARIRVTTLCVFRHDGRVLITEGVDPQTGERFFRPLGGGVEFGERAADALRREIDEELGLDIDAPRLLGVIENHFVYDAKRRHEIVFVFDAAFRDPSVYDRAELPITEPFWNGAATWMGLDALGGSTQPVYPEGLLDLLGESADS